ncbi:hypothetical protein G3578_13670 [Brevibacillus sp. SYP-B805]|uniref:hypothetical protein n=1 Tax=Brevibacillus sp. SYP-B805 TaxID=1578199 RepID=UPI0013EA1715|nr:hypothetical protein [Brevibacillus sp. SYP-B805]NGQ96210.1 hypothetical protein [Brevibacillus sp. SYP-B805]
MGEWVGGLIFIMMVAFFTPILWIVLTIAIFTFFATRKLWITYLVIVPVAAFFYLAFYGGDTGWFSTPKDRLLIAAGAAADCMLLVTIVGVIANKVRRKEIEQPNGHEETK